MVLFFKYYKQVSLALCLVTVALTVFALGCDQHSVALKELRLAGLNLLRDQQSSDLCPDRELASVPICFIDDFIDRVVDHISRLTGTDSVEGVRTLVRVISRVRLR